MKINIKGVIIPNDDKWVYEWLELDAVCPRDVVNAIEKAGGELLEVYINSGGGDIFAGAEIYAALEAYQGSVQIHVVSAGSAASVIACAGESDMVRTGLFMYHNVSGGTRGDYRAMDKNSEVLQTANRAVCAAYTQKTGRSEAELLADMDAETWLTAQQAVEKGFIDRIAENQNLRLTAGFGNTLPPAVIEKIRSSKGKNSFERKKAQAQHTLLEQKIWED